MRFPALAIVIASLLALAACGGSSSTPTPSAAPTATATTAVTPTPVPSGPTPVPTLAPTDTPAPQVNCDPSALKGAFVMNQGTAGIVYYQLGLTDIGSGECNLAGPPSITLEDALGDPLGVPVNTENACPVGGPYDPATCIDNEPIHLLPGDATPGAGTSPGQVTVTVAVAAAGNFNCTTAYEADFFALRFPGIGSDIRISIPTGIDVLNCTGVAQVTLHGYGPSGS